LSNALLQLDAAAIVGRFQETRREIKEEMVMKFTQSIFAAAFAFAAAAAFAAPVTTQGGGGGKHGGH